MWCFDYTLVLCTLIFQLNFAGASGVTDARHWYNYGKEQIQRAVDLERLNNNVAKNVIVFIGDGFDVTTNTAARILKGQLSGGVGAEANMVWDDFPHVSLSKTYNTDRQVPDSAGTATALFTGVKTKLEVLGVDDTIEFEKCSTVSGAAVDSVLVSAEQAGKATGIISTARITHATPASLYAHSASRRWEYDGKIPPGEAADGCIDIAAQLLHNGAEIEVVLGGGREYFTSNTTADPEYPESMGLRQDGRNLIEEWKGLHQEDGSTYVWNANQFDIVNPRDTDFLLGLFEPSHMQYEHDRPNDGAGEPSLAEMTEKAIQILQKNKIGFFLMVEGGRIDHAHHDNNAWRALTDTQAMDKAVAKALEMVNLDETLLIVTGDHAHVMTVNGYPYRGNPIFGIVNNDYEKATDGLPIATLTYSNGPGGYLELESFNKTGLRRNLTEEETSDPDFINPAQIPTEDETHGGQDTAIFATGARAHLFHGVHEDCYVAHVIRYAACMGTYTDDEDCMTGNSASYVRFNIGWILVALMLILL